MIYDLWVCQSAVEVQSFLGFALSDLAGSARQAFFRVDEVRSQLPFELILIALVFDHFFSDYLGSLFDKHGGLVDLSDGSFGPIVV